MRKVLKRGEDIRNFLLKEVFNNPENLKAAELKQIASKKFNIHPASVACHLRQLVNAGQVLDKNGFLVLKKEELVERTLPLNQKIDEERVYAELVAPQIANVSANAEKLIAYAFTEMVNNAKDHSGGTELRLRVWETPFSTTVLISDNGIGIFKKIKQSLNLSDEKQSILELSKGKFTTDPTNHTGEGVFFASRMCDSFFIFSGANFYAHDLANPRDTLSDSDRLGQVPGTHILFQVNNHTSRSIKKVFDKYATVDDGFTKTEVLVRLVRYKNEGLISRSQAKRMLNRVDRFQAVVFNFEGVDLIGQAFADQVFRVFKNAHPGIQISTIKTNSTIDKMIRHVTRQSDEPTTDPESQG